MDSNHRPAPKATVKKAPKTSVLRSDAPDPVIRKRRERWAKALLSGKYKQGKEALRPKTDKFCCLGVACDVFKKDLSLGWNQRFFDGRRDGLSSRMLDFLGLTRKQEHILVEMNDSEGKSFSAIARVLLSFD